MSTALTSSLGQERTCSSPVCLHNPYAAIYYIATQQKNHCPYYPKEKRFIHHFLLLCRFTALPPASFHGVLFFLNTVLRCSCHVACWRKSAIPATNASRIRLSSIFFLTLFSLQKSILLLLEKIISFVHILFTNRSIIPLVIFC